MFKLVSNLVQNFQCGILNGILDLLAFKNARKTASRIFREKNNNPGQRLSYELEISKIFFVCFKNFGILPHEFRRINNAVIFIQVSNFTKKCEVSISINIEIFVNKLLSHTLWYQKATYT